MTQPEPVTTPVPPGEPAYRPDQLLAARHDGPDQTGPLVDWEPVTPPVPPEAITEDRRHLPRAAMNEIRADLACGHSMRRHPPGLRVPLQYRCWRCKSPEVVLAWFALRPPVLDATRR